MLVVGLLFYLPSQTRQFSKVQFPIGFGFWILDFPFTKSPSQLPKVRPIANFLSSYYGGNWKIQKSPNAIAQNSPNSPKNLPISNPAAKVKFPKSKNYPT
jgi:hypothetical protein